MAFRTGIVERSVEDNNSPGLEVERIRELISQLTDARLVLFPQDYLYFQKIRSTLKDTAKLDTAELKELNLQVRDYFSGLAEEFSLYLSPGTVIEAEDGVLYRCGLLFNPTGELILEQRQLFFSEKEKALGFQGESQLYLAETELGRIGFIIGTDSWYPEVGRFLSLEGVDIVLAPTSLPDCNYWQQLAGIWSQVQQNQFFALEAISGGLSLIHGPCEITPFRTGIIAPCGEREEALTGDPSHYLQVLDRRIKEIRGARVITGILDLKRLEDIRNSYPLRKFLNPSLYQKSGLENLAIDRRRNGDGLGRMA